MYKVLAEEKLVKKISYYQKENSFYTTLRNRINEYFETTGSGKQDAPGMYLKTVLQLSLWIGFYTAMLSNHFQGWGLFFMQMGFHFTMFLMSVGIAHDGSHSSYSKHPWLNKVMYRVFDLIGINSHMWEYNHNLSHHYVPNIPLYDSAIDSFGLFRFHPRAKYLNFHKFQHFYIFIVYSGATLFKIFFLDFFSFARKNIGNVKVGKHAVKDILYLVFTKLFVLAYTLIIPVLVIDVPAWQVIGGFLAGNVLMGITLGIVFQVTHLSDNTVFAEPDDNGTIYNSFPMHIIATTADFAPDNKIVTWISGGLNLHVAHHLFPKISQVHLPAITKILKQTSIEFGVPYKVYPTVKAALKSHFRLLKKLGKKEQYNPTEWPLNKADLSL